MIGTRRLSEEGEEEGEEDGDRRDGERGGTRGGRFLIFGALRARRESERVSISGSGRGSQGALRERVARGAGQRPGLRVGNNASRNACAAFRAQIRRLVDVVAVLAVHAANLSSVDTRLQEAFFGITAFRERCALAGLVVVAFLAVRRENFSGRNLDAFFGILIGAGRANVRSALVVAIIAFSDDIC